MLQNLYLAGASRKPGAFNIHFQQYEPCPFIIGRRLRERPPNVPLSQLPPPGRDFEPLEQVGGVMGSLMALETRFPKAGASLVSIFFPGSLKYEPGRFKFQWEKEFWKERLGEDKQE